MSNFPLLSGTDRPVYPHDGSCPVCGSAFHSGFAYLSAGALHLSADGRESLNSDRDQAFLHFGFHGRNIEMRDSTDVSVVSELQGGQFDLQWCSVDCMRTGLVELLRRIEPPIDCESSHDIQRS